MSLDPAACVASQTGKCANRPLRHELRYNKTLARLLFKDINFKPGACAVLLHRPYRHVEARECFVFGNTAISSRETLLSKIPGH